MKTSRVHRALRSCVVALSLLTASAAHAAESEPQPLRDMKVFRFEFDNDLMLGSDDAFTAGWSAQVHSALLDRWPRGFEGWIGRIPTLGDDGEGGRIVRWSWGITQLMMTPRDVTISAPQPDDVPWAGMLGGYLSWSAYDNRRLAALQVYLGCIGPCAHAESAQKFVHEGLGLGASPKGWANQSDDDLLFNLSYQYRRKLWSGAARYDTAGLGTDLSVGTEAGIGSFATYAEAWIEYRFGWDVPRGFAKLADPPAMGVALDPVYLDPSGPATVRRGWRPYFNLIARLRSVEDFAPLRDGNRQEGGNSRPPIPMPGHQQVIFGAHFAKIPLAFHLTYYRYLDGIDVTGRLGADFSWVNFSFERRF